MNKIHRWVSGMLTIGLLVSALSGCAALEALKALQKDPDNGTTQTDGDGDKLPDGSRDPSSSRTPSGGKQPGGGRDPAGGNDPSGLEDQADGEEIIPLEELSLEMLQEEIIQNGGSAGIAIIGYVDSQSTEAFLREYVAYSYVGGKRFFLQDADIVMTEGQELYAVVPATPEGTVTVYASSISEMGEYVDDSTPLYTGDPGEAVIVLCNISEIYSNVLVSVSDGFSAVAFRPGLSGMDGHVAAEPGVYDFSIYIDEADQATIQRAQEKLMQLADVNTAVQQGMTLLYGWTDYVGGHVCPVFALGSMDGEFFEPQYFYAVADDGIISVRGAQEDIWRTWGT